MKIEGSGLKVIILGSGTCVPTGKRGPAAIALVINEEVVLIDAGSGCLEKLSRCGFSFTSISTVIITHFHVDHTSDLPLLLFANNYAPGMERTEKLTIVGPDGLAEFMENLVTLYRWVEPKGYAVDLVEGISPSGKIGDYLAYTTCQALHGDGRALSVRIDSPWGSLTCSGDTGYHQELVNLAKDTDLLIIEASFMDEETAGQGHLTPEIAARVAREANAKKVVLTHLYPDTAGRDPKGVFSRFVEVPVLVAHDLLCMTLDDTSTI